MIKLNVYYIEIYHPSTDVIIETTKQHVDKISDAVEYFEYLNDLISEFTTSYEGIIIETDTGWIRLPSDYLASSIMKLHCETIDSFEDEIDS